MTDATEYARCPLCGKEIRDDHDAELLEHSNDLVHTDCIEERRGDQQGTLTEY